MAEDVAEATESLDKEAGLVGLDRPLDQLDLTKMLAESIGTEEQDRSEETSPSGDASAAGSPHKAVDRATCLNGQRVWKTNSMMEELTVADRTRLVRCWQCHPSVP